MVQTPQRPNYSGSPRQQSLFPELQGDPRLLVPGWAGDLCADEFEYVLDQLIRDKILARSWGFKPSTKRLPDQAIRRLALSGDPDHRSANRQLANQDGLI